MSNLYIQVLGGTIAGEAELKEVDVQTQLGNTERRIRSITEPKHGKIQELVKYQLSDIARSRFDHIVVEEADMFIDSADGNCDTIEHAVALVREQLRARVGNLVICYGTDGAAFLSQALAEAITPEQLGDKRGIIIAVAQHAAPKRPLDATGAIDQNSTDAARNLEHATYFSRMEETNGRIGVLVDGILYPPRGLRKSRTKHMNPFASRYGMMSSAPEKGPTYRWSKLNKPENVELPAGINARYKLIPGVESLGLDATSNYENLAAMVQGGIDKQTLNGIVIQAPGNGNLRNIERDRKIMRQTVEFAADKGVPIVVIGDPMQPHDGPDEEETVYPGDAKLFGGQLIQGNGLQPAEAKLITSESLYNAKRRLHLHGPAVIDYVRMRMQAYIQYVDGAISQQDYINLKSKM